jgi:hypothetical protein
MPAPGHYAAYGLAIDSDRPLPGATPAPPAPADLTIRFTDDAEPPVDREARDTGEDLGWQSTTRRPGGDLEFRCASDGGTRAWTLGLSADGSRMEVRSTPGLADVLAYVVTRGLAASLVLRGVPLLHACAVEGAGGATLVVGASGMGKSTFAAAAVASGSALLADDMAALAWHGGRLHVSPGLTHLRLDAATAAQLGWEPSGLPAVFADPRLPRKRRIALSAAEGSFCPTPRAVAAIHVLGPRSADGPHVERLSPARALPVLLANAFAADLLDRPAVAAMLPFWASVASDVPVYEVRPAVGVGSLPALARSLGAATHA